MKGLQQQLFYRWPLCPIEHVRGYSPRSQRKSRVAETVDHIRVRENSRSGVRANSMPISDHVLQVLKKSNLETPEGVSLEKMFAITEAFWSALKNPKQRKAPRVVDVDQHSLDSDPEYDVCICGGTLGIVLAVALQMQGHSVCIVEKRKVEGRAQEWNISRSDFNVLVRLGIVTQNELEQCVATSWSRDRIVFHGASCKQEEHWVTDALDLGVDPKKLISLLQSKFLRHGGDIYEFTLFKKAIVHSNGVSLKLAPANISSEDEYWTAGDVNRTGVKGSTAGTKVVESLSCRLLVDCMGHYSSIVKQQRHGQPIEGVVIVVGGCMTGIPQQDGNHADLLVTINDSENDMQYFWEAFPAEGGQSRTVYMFAYSDASPTRPSFDQIFSTFLTDLENYQGVNAKDVTFKRILLGGFPCYSKNVPLKPSFDRIIQVGDASAVQSPLSFGGFASLCRHLPRISRSISHALSTNSLKKSDLALINPYLPNLCVAWLFQRAMSIKVGQQKIRGRQGGWIPAAHINNLMRCNFAVMSFLGPKVILPFIQDSFRALPLGLVMIGMMIKDPMTIIKVLFQLGPKLVIMWMLHYACLLAYTLLYVSLTPLRHVFKGSYVFQRILDALEWGSGFDNVHGDPKYPKEATA